MLKAVALLIVLLALGVETWLLAFLQNWIPRGIDAGVPRPWPLALAIDLGLIALFGLSHSVMARPAFKRWWTRRIPPALERSIYLLVSALTLALLCTLWSPLPQLLWSVELPLARTLVYAAFFAGIGLMLWAILTLDPLAFHGLKQVFRPGAGDPPFAARGPYRYVRHPIQTGLIIALWATPALSVGHALLAGVLTAYSLYATLRLEERDLVGALGQTYRDYQRRVPALLPGWRR